MSINYRFFRRIDAELFSSDMRTQPWCVLDAFDDTDDMTDAFNNFYLDIWDTQAPLKKRPAPKQHQPWMTMDILTLLRSRSRLYKKCCASRTDDAWNAYKVKRNKCTASIRLAKRIYLLDSARHKPLMFWRQVKSCTGLGKTKRSLLPWPCSTPVISKSSANALNEHFIASVRSAIPSSNNSSESKCSINNTPNDVSYDKFSFREITVSDIASVINNIAASGSPGTDGISPHMLKFSLGSISSVLVSLGLSNWLPFQLRGRSDL